MLVDASSTDEVLDELHHAHLTYCMSLAIAAAPSSECVSCPDPSLCYTGFGLSLGQSGVCLDSKLSSPCGAWHPKCAEQQRKLPKLS